MKLKQSIDLNLIGNARELGGYPTADGKKVRSGVLLRTAALKQASEEDIRILQNRYHLQHIIDFRMGFELQGADDPTIDGADYHHLDVIDVDAMGYATPDNVDISTLDVIDIIELSINSGMVNEKMYIGFLSNEKGKNAFSEFFRVLLRADPDRAVLWHCTSGKDRTGLAAMLLLSALGVEEEVIVEDYLLTNTYYAPRIAGLTQLLKAKGCEDEFIAKAILVFDAVDEQFLKNAIRYLKKEYGSVRGYIIDGLKISQEEIEALKQKYLV